MLEDWEKICGAPESLNEDGDGFYLVKLDNNVTLQLNFDGPKDRLMAAESAVNLGRFDKI